jgi:hypothetical protein
MHGHELRSWRQLVLEGDLLKQLRISDALVELVFSPLRSVEDVMDTYFADDYVHCMNGIAYSRADFAARASGARLKISHGTVTTLDELRDGQSYAERHLLDIVNSDGSVERTEVFVIGQYSPDGRFARLNEAGFPVVLPEATVS